MSRNNLIYGAVILFGANLVNRMLGFVYQYLIMHYIGSEAYGLFYMVFPVYMTALVLTTAGIPLAVSKMIAEKVSLGNYNEAGKVFRTAFSILFFTGLVVTILLYLNCSFIVTHFFADARIQVVFKICIPCIFIVSVASAFRGYFQGLQNMVPSALSQVFEQIFRIAVGFSLSLHYLDNGIEWAAAGLAAGMLCGEIVGLIVIFIHYLFKRIRYPEKNQIIRHHQSIIRELLGLSLPVTGSRLMATGISSLDTFIIPKQLQLAGFSARNATSLFGEFSGTALTLFSFPTVFTFALSSSLVPAISESLVRNDLASARKKCSDALKYTVLMGLPCVIILFFFADPLCHLFKSDSAAAVVRILSIGGIFAYLQQTTTGILQGMGKTTLPLVHMLMTSVIRIPLLFYLTGMPLFGLLGAGLAYVFGFFSMAFLNLYAIHRHLGLEADYGSIIVKPMIGGLAMAAVITGITRLNTAGNVPVLVTCLAASVIGLCLYFIILVCTGAIHIKDLKKTWQSLIPKR